MTAEFERRCRSLAGSLGLCAPEEVETIGRLTGGVASDIATLTFGGKTVCVKFALAKLKVKEDWFAPAHRGHAEFAWLTAAGKVVPEAIPTLYGWSEEENGFAMEFLDGPDIRLWKTELLQGIPDSGEAAAVAATLGRIHAASSLPDFNRSPFHNSADFESLRLEPYLRFTAGQHPDVAERLQTMADQLSKASQVLIHGDISPKNILLRHVEDHVQDQVQPVFLDAECATLGDPAFDVAFALNHLILKSFHLPHCRARLHTDTAGFWAHYVPHVSWEDPAALEARVSALLPALMLARIDGKSPVEYLTEDSRRLVRHSALSLLRQPPTTILQLLESRTLRTER